MRKQQIKLLEAAYRLRFCAPPRDFWRELDARGFGGTGVGVAMQRAVCTSSSPKCHSQRQTKQRQ
jgi:hypothetical protein